MIFYAQIRAAHLGHPRDDEDNHSLWAFWEARVAGHCGGGAGRGGDLLSTTWVKNFRTLKCTNKFLGFFLLALCQPKSRVRGTWCNAVVVIVAIEKIWTNKDRVGPGVMLLLSQLRKYEPSRVPCRTRCNVVVVVAIEKIWTKQIWTNQSPV